MITFRRITPADSGCAANKRADLLKHLLRKEGDLPLVVVLVVEETVATDTAPGNTLDLLHRQQGIRPRLLRRNGREFVPR